MVSWIAEKLKQLPITIVIMLYLWGMMLGTADFFTGQHIGAVILVGWGLACAAELHSYLVQLRVRVLGAQLGKLNSEDPHFAKLQRELVLQRRAMYALIGFSIYNSVAFWATQLHPVGFWDWVNVIGRGLIVPCLFYVAGHLHPIAADATDLLEQANSRMLMRTMKALTTDMKKRIEKAERERHDFTPLTVALLLDVGKKDEARRIQMISDGLRRTEQSAPSAKSGKSSNLYYASAQAQPGAKPTQFQTQTMNENPDEIQGKRKPRRAVPRSPKARIYRILDRMENPAYADVTEIARGAKCDWKTAKKYYDKWCDANSIELRVS